MSSSEYCEICKKEVLEIKDVIENIGDIKILCGDCSKNYTIFCIKIPAKQERLGEEFEKILHENLNDLYET